MCKTCGCETGNKPIQYECQCSDEECNCGIVEFDEEPNAVPYCCGTPMKRKK
ncbi:MAG: hypothetical protein JSU91_07675 [Thermoplasmatales archaeon]|nr:MAG: hypothetical protein JSU91_07675 [Thermoplasmatales archaeon]